MCVWLCVYRHVWVGVSECLSACGCVCVRGCVCVCVSLPYGGSDKNDTLPVTAEVGLDSLCNMSVQMSVSVRSAPPLIPAETLLLAS